MSYIVNCHHLLAAQKVRKGGKFLRSFGKLWEVVLPTFLLIINELVQKGEEIKNCAVWT